MLLPVVLVVAVIVAGIVVAAVTVAGTAALAGGSPRFEFIDNRPKSAVVDHSSSECRLGRDGQVTSPRLWKATGHTAGKHVQFRGLSVGHRSLILWRDDSWYEQRVGGQMEVGWSNRDSLQLFGTGAAPPGLSFDATGARAEQVCALWLTAPLASGNSTIGIILERPVAWTTLAVGDSAFGATIAHDRFSVRRTAAATWVFEVANGSSPTENSVGGRLTLTTDGAAPPWSHLDIALDMDGASFGMKAVLHIGPPVDLDPG